MPALGGLYIVRLLVGVCGDSLGGGVVCVGGLCGLWGYVLSDFPRASRPVVVGSHIHHLAGRDDGSPSDGRTIGC